MSEEELFLTKKKKKQTEIDEGESHFPDDDKLALNIDIVQLLNEVAESLARISQAVQHYKDHKYGPALAAILAVIQNLFEREVVPRITPKK